MRFKAGLTLRQIGEDYVIVEPEQEMVDFSKVYSLNESAAFLWNSLQEVDFTISEVVDLLMTNYEVTAVNRDVVTLDAQSLLDKFKEQGLIIG